MSNTTLFDLYAYFGSLVSCYKWKSHKRLVNDTTTFIFQIFVFYKTFIL